MRIHAHRTTLPSFLTFLLSSALGLAAASPVQATTTTWYYTATVRDYWTGENTTPPASWVALGIDVGTPVTGFFVVDDTLPDTSPGDPTTGTYPGAVLDAQLVAGDLTLSFTVPGGVTSALDRFITGFPPEGLSLYKLYSSGVDSSASGLLSAPFFELDLVDSGQDVITTEALPSVPPALSEVDAYDPTVAFRTAVAFGLDANDSGFVWAEITSLTVPEPGTLALLGAGLISAMGASRRRPRR